MKKLIPLTLCLALLFAACTTYAMPDEPAAEPAATERIAVPAEPADVYDLPDEEDEDAYEYDYDEPAQPVEASAVTTQAAAQAQATVANQVTSAAATSTAMQAATQVTATTAPARFPGVPQAFWPVLDNLCPYGPPVTGYAIADINNDGTPELILFFRDQRLHSLYTLHNNAPALLGDWSHRSGAVITTDGTIFDWSSNSAESSIYRSLKLAPGADSLTTLTHYTTDFINGQNVFRADDDGPWQPLTPEKDAQFRNHDNQPNPMQFNIIPIG